MRIEATPQVTLADINRLDANKRYFLSSTTGRIKEASIFMKIKCALGICGAKEKVANLIEAVKTTLLRDVGKPADEQLDIDIKRDIDRGSNIKGGVLQSLARKFRTANSDAFVRREALRMATGEAKQGFQFAHQKTLTSGEEKDVKQIFDHAFKPLVQGDLPTCAGKNGHVELDADKFGEQLKEKREEAVELLREIGSNARLGNPMIDRHYAYHIITTLFNEDGTRNEKTIDDLMTRDEAFAYKLFDRDDHLRNLNTTVYRKVTEDGGDSVEYARKIRERCGGDKDVEDIVEWGLRGICMDDIGDMRDEQEVFNRIDAIKSNFAEAREVAKTFPGFMPEFTAAMYGLNGGAMPEGTLKRMAEAVERADFSKIAKLNSFSDSGAILKAIDQLRHTAEPIANVSRYKGGVVDTVDYNAYRKIVEAMAVLKAGPAAVARIRNAMHSMACRHAAVILDRFQEEAEAHNLYPDANVREIRSWFFAEERRALDEVWEIFQPHDRAPDPIDTDDIDYKDSFNSTNVDFNAMFQAHIDAKLKEAGLIQ